MSASGVHFIYTLFGSQEDARRIAMTLLSEKLIACANHLGSALSQYEWKGEFCEEQEFPVIFKTGVEMVEAAMARLAELHPYDTPAILSWSAERVSADYAGWIIGQTA